MNILILYATNSGGTYEVSKIIEEVLIERKHRVKVQSVTKAKSDDIDQHDIVVFGSCTWQIERDNKKLDGQLPEHFHAFIKRLNGKQWNGKQFAIFGLGDSTYAQYCGATKHLETLVSDLKGTRIGEPLKIGEYFFNVDENHKHITTWTETIADILKLK